MDDLFDPMQSKDRFVALDGLRGVAALAVLWGHLWSEAERRAGVSLEGHAWTLPNSGLAVDFFFCLSGFVLAASYGERLTQGRVSAPAFLKRRLIRLYPLIAFSLALAVVVFAQVAPLEAVLPLAGLNLLLLPTPLGLPARIPAAYPINAPSWSLAFELVCNALYAAIGRWLRLRETLTLVAVLFVGLTAQVFLTHDPAQGARWESFGGGFLRAGYAYFAGWLIHQLWVRGWLGRIRAPLPAIVVVLLALFALTSAPGGLKTQALILLAMPALVLIGCGARARGWTERLCALGGELSFPVYILQWPLIAGIGLAKIKLGVADAPILMAAEGLLICAISWLALTLYDIPLRAWLGRPAAHAKRRLALEGGTG